MTVKPLPDRPELAALRRGLAVHVPDADVYLVGGIVRDNLLGNIGNGDIDLVTEGDPIAICQTLYQAGISDFPPTVFTQFGTVMISIGGTPIEWVAARSESYRGDSRKPETQPASLLDDAMRRDFTVNSLLQNLRSGEVLDLTGHGLADLENRILRTPTDPNVTFLEDPLRLYRAVRFKFKLGFEFAPGLAEAVKRNAGRVSILSPERVRDELNQTILLPRADEAFQELMGLGLLQMIPEFSAMIGVEQGNYHHLDVWNHTLLVLKNVIRFDPEADLNVRWAALLHDVGKPKTRIKDDEGRTRFFGHEGVGAILAEQILRRLKFANSDAARVSLLVKNHMRLGMQPKLSAPAARRLVRDLEDNLENLILLVRADCAALKPGVKTINVDDIWNRLNEVKQETAKGRWVSPLSGQEIMDQFGLSPGPKVGQIKKMLDEKVLDGQLHQEDKRSAIELAKNWLALNHGTPGS